MGAGVLDLQRAQDRGRPAPPRAGHGRDLLTGRFASRIRAPARPKTRAGAPRAAPRGRSPPGPPPAAVFFRSSWGRGVSSSLGTPPFMDNLLAAEGVSSLPRGPRDQGPLSNSRCLPTSSPVREAQSMPRCRRGAQRLRSRSESTSSPRGEFPRVSVPPTRWPGLLPRSPLWLQRPSTLRSG